MSSISPTTTTRTCARCRSNPTLTPALDTCRQCLRRQCEIDRENRRAAQRLALQRARDERARRSWQAPAGLAEPEGDAP
jgi:hypothetical protein